VATLNDHAEALATELRRRLGERRRADAAAGRRDGGELADAVAELVAEEAAVLSPERRELIGDLIIRETAGLGPLEELLADPDVEEVMVNGHERVYVERGDAWSAPPCDSGPSARCGTRSSVSWHPSVAASTS